MASVTGVISDVSGYGAPGSAYQMLWTPITNTNVDGTALQLPSWSDRSVQFSGTWNGATAVLQGSLDGVTYFTLTDPQGNAISKTSDGLEQIEENVRYIKPSTSGGGASTSISCFVLCAGYRVR